MNCVVAPNCNECTRHMATDCIFTVHDYQVQGCDNLREFCAHPDDWGNAGRAGHLAKFLTDVRLHMSEEEELLIPLLKEFGIIHDGGGEWSLIEAEHRRDSHTLNRVASELTRLARDEEPGNAATLIVGGIAFAENYLRHIAGEEDELRPLAHSLTEDQHNTLWALLRARRGQAVKGSGR